MADTSAFLPVSQPQDGAGSVDGLLKDLNELLDSDGSISSVKDNANQNLVGCAQTMQENIDIMGSTDPIGQRDRLEQLYHSYNNRCAEVERLEQVNRDLSERIVVVTKENEMNTMKHQEVTTIHSAKIAELERRILELEYQLKAARDRGVAQEVHHKKAVEELNAKYSERLEQTRKSTEKAHKEKETAVIKFASREKEILDLKAQGQKLSSTVMHLTTERDALNSRLRGAKNERDSIAQKLEQKESELTELKRKFLQMESYQAEAEIRVKMATKRVDEVEEQHKGSKMELEKTTKRLKEAKEEAETIRTNCNQIIQKYQESEEFKSNSLDKELNEKLELMKIQRQEQSDQEEIYKVISLELESLKRQHKLTLKDMEDLNCQLRSSEKETAEQERRVIDCQCTIGVQTKKISDLERELILMHQVVGELEREKTMKRALELQVAELQEYNEDLKRDAEVCRTNAEKNLEINQKLSEAISKLQADNTSLISEVEHYKQEVKDLYHRHSEIKSNYDNLIRTQEQLEDRVKCSENRLLMECQLKDHREKELQKLIDDEQNRNKILQKKHSASVKELKSELNSLKRRLDAYEAGTASQCSVGSDGTDEILVSSRTALTQSPTPSISSLSETSLVPLSRLTTRSDANSSVSLCQNNPILHSQQCQALSDQNQMMVEKIVKLQRLLARRAEKLEFLEEHVRQLIVETQRKSRIIQMYALREETGALAPATADFNKAEMSKKGLTLMGLLFTGNAATGNDRLFSQENSISLDLSLQINRKLQCVLEDILLKNIMMKDNLDTLGAEISKLSRENRELQIKLSHQELAKATPECYE